MQGGLVSLVDHLRRHPGGVGDAAPDQEVEQVRHRPAALLGRPVLQGHAHLPRIRPGQNRRTGFAGSGGVGPSQSGSSVRRWPGQLWVERHSSRVQQLSTGWFPSGAYASTMRTAYGAQLGALTEQLNHMIVSGTDLTFEWVAEAVLDAQPDLVRTMSVAPPRGAGDIRMVRIPGIDYQPCGGTHVQSLSEISPLIVSKIENKGRQNRRVHLVFA